MDRHGIVHDESGHMEATNPAERASGVTIFSQRMAHVLPKAPNPKDWK